jgi:uncharacterized protein YjbJ (UPF0337 family)
MDVGRQPVQHRRSLTDGQSRSDVGKPRGYKRDRPQSRNPKLYEEQGANMKTSTEDKIKGSLHEVKGAIKEQAGKVTKNCCLETKGKVEKTAGKIQHLVGDAEEAVEPLKK